MSWDSQLFRRSLTTRTFGHEFVWLEEIDSTNQWLMDHRDEFLLSGGTVATDHQTAGRGRRDRSWHDRPGACLLFSVLHRTSASVEVHSVLNLIPAIALARILKSDSGPSASIHLKWPNDVLMNGRKLAGVLGQSSVQGNSRFAVIGMGVNVSITESDMPEDVRIAATSLAIETGRSFQRELLLAGILHEWEELYDDFRLGRLDRILEEWMEFGPGIGTPISRAEGEVTMTGTFEGLGKHGQLLLRDANGKIHEIFSGDVDA